MTKAILDQKLDLFDCKSACLCNIQKLMFISVWTTLQYI